MLDAHRKKLKFRAWRRGFREMDLLMGTFADAHLEDMSEDELSQFERLLATPDWDVFAWLVGQKPIPDEFKGDLLDQLMTFRYHPQAG